MTIPAPAQTLEDAKDHAIKSWYLFTDNRGLKARIPDWRTSTAPDGSPALSVEVVGPGAAYALSLFASQYHLVLGHPGDQRPQFDYSVPGRTSCVWRRAGVWVELWHPDTLPASPQPVPPVSAPAEVAAPGTSGRNPRGGLFGPSGRLVFTRRPKTTKENATT